jgi:hypothetical protein
MILPTAQEQLFLELVNRARMDPLGEAARFGCDLNAGLGRANRHPRASSLR